MENCNVCGKELEENNLHVQKTDDGTEYYICSHCKNEGVEINEASDYYICKQCGYPHQNDEFTGVCKFCEQRKDFKKIKLTEVEEELLDTNPQKLYKEKLGEESAKKIAKWIESPERKEVGIRHRRDRIIDTASAVGIILAYILLEVGIRNYSENKITFLALMIPTISVLAASPLFKKADRKKQLPLWSIYVILALLVDVYIIIAKIFG